MPSSRGFVTCLAWSRAMHLSKDSQGLSLGPILPKSTLEANFLAYPPPLSSCLGTRGYTDVSLRCCSHIGWPRGFPAPIHRSASHFALSPSLLPVPRPILPHTICQEFFRTSPVRTAWRILVLCLP